MNVNILKKKKSKTKDFNTIFIAPTEKEKTVKARNRLIIKFVVIVVAVFILLNYVGGIYICHDNNMYPGVKDGDLVITYRLGGYYFGDIVVYEHNGKKYFGRVTATSGDTIEIFESNGYSVNGAIPYETVYYATERAENSNITYPYTVKDGEVFIMNDLRDNKNDSRTFGGVEKLYGKVVLLLRRRGF